MSKDELIEVEGVVTDLLPNTHFVVRLKNSEHRIIAHASGKIRKGRIRILMGDTVLVQITKYDMTKGRIVRRRKA